MVTYAEIRSIVECTARKPLLQKSLLSSGDATKSHLDSVAVLPLFPFSSSERFMRLLGEDGARSMSIGFRNNYLNRIEKNGLMAYNGIDGKCSFLSL